MDDRAICLPWNKNCVDTPRTDDSLWRITYNLLTFYKGIRRYPSVSRKSGKGQCYFVINCD